MYKINWLFEKLLTNLKKLNNMALWGENFIITDHNKGNHRQTIFLITFDWANSFLKRGKYIQKP